MESIQEIEREGQADQQSESDGDVDDHKEGAYQRVDGCVNLPTRASPAELRDFWLRASLAFALVVSSRMGRRSAKLTVCPFWSLTSSPPRDRLPEVVPWRRGGEVEAETRSDDVRSLTRASHILFG